MNHPIIANENAKAHFNEMLHDAEQFRLANKVSKRYTVTQLINTIISLFI